MSADLAAELRAAFGSRPEPVCAVCAYDAGGEPIGMTATSVTSVSLDPPMVLLCAKATSLIATPLRARLPFVVHLLAAGQEETARRLATPIDDKFAEVRHRAGVGGAVLLDDSLAVLHCAPAQVHAAGDHVVVIGEVERIERGPDAPALAYHRGRFIAV